MADKLHLVRDVLDKQVFDINNQKLGKVDGVILMLRANRPPRVTAIEIDMKTAWRRVHPRIAGWIERLQRWLAPDGAEPTRIRFAHVVKTGIDVYVDIDGNRTNVHYWESWLRRRFVDRIPGGNRGVK
ncbi:MAG TPA: hypothetical protein VFJ02_02890 [Vicinamibacterales bacterium]|nr:hypothetical protein [Vicinamibacterales bacterium]